MRRILFSVGILFILGFLSSGFSVTRGKGPPDIREWCAADWLVGCSSGIAALTSCGLYLSNLTAPPRSAYELELKLIPYRALLFVFQSEQAVGNVIISIDEVTLETVPVAAGTWWLCLDELPAEGTLRLELDDNCGGLVLRSLYFPCRCEQAPASPCPEPTKFLDCHAAYYQGFLFGAGLTATLLLLAYLILGQ